MKNNKPKSGEKIRVSLTLSPDIYNELEREATRRRKRTGKNVTRSSLFELVLRTGLKEMLIRE